MSDHDRDPLETSPLVSFKDGSVTIDTGGGQDTSPPALEMEKEMETSPSTKEETESIPTANKELETGPKQERNTSGKVHKVREEHQSPGNQWRDCQEPE